MAALLERLDLSCISLGPGCRNLDTDLAPGSGLIEEIDFFGVGKRIESGRLDGFFPQWSGDFQGRRMLAAAVNGPFRVSYPEAPTLVLHLTIWPETWLTKVCPFVVNGFRRAQVFVGKKPDSFLSVQRPEPKELLNWHYGLKNCRRYIDQEGFEAPTWWLDGRPRDGKIMFHDISGSYRRTEFIAYTLNSALANIAHFPVLHPPSSQRLRLLAAEFRRCAVAARNAVPVDPAWLAKKTPAAVSLIDRLIEELQAVV
jgi:hypothetical protein